MLLATKCPHCKTTFKVANDQLKLQSGLVRCGICHQVFNGIEHLTPNAPGTNTIKINPSTATAVTATAKEVTEESGALEPTVPEERELDMFESFGITDERKEPSLDANTPQLAGSFFSSELNDAFSNSQTKAQFEEKIQALLDADLLAEKQAIASADGNLEEIVLEQAEPEDFFAEPVEPEPEPEPDFSIEWPPAQPAEPDDEPDDESDEKPPEAVDEEPSEVPDESNYDDLTELIFIRQAKFRKRLNWFLSVSIVLLLILLAGQSVYQFRDLIAAAYPGSKDSLLTLCKMAHCQINLPAQVDAISYEADELHTLPRENTFEFSLLMRNHSSLAQAWPSIELTLKGDRKQVQLRRVFGPADYLPNPRDVTGGFQAGQEQSVKLYFVLDKVPATDYVVSIFYP